MSLPQPTALSRRLLAREVWLVFALSLGASGVFALISLIGDATSGTPLRRQATVVAGSYAPPDRPWLELAFQLAHLTFRAVPVLLALYLLARSGETRHDIGLDGAEPARDAGRGMALAAVVGGAGLGFYLLVHALGVNLTVVAADLPAVWWRYPVLVLQAFSNGLLEEVLVAAYLLRRLAQLGWSDGRALAVSAGLRGSYHLYQGLGGFAANAVMGVVFGRLYQRWGRVVPLVVAHTLQDTVAFVGYTLLAGHVSWLPTA